ncbi:MAG TPA: tetratricopeptide repeat protein [Candidatus Aminicenantes bacterium]|nr:tetratricopeptide repeat protein [Candidatus Aminicenantes bacterium]
MRRAFPPVIAAVVVAALAACARPLSVGALRAGVAAARADDWDAALRHWTEAVRLSPGSAAAHNNLAVAHERRGDWEAARAEYEEAVRLAPNDLAIRTNCAAFELRAEAAREKGK